MNIILRTDVENLGQLGDTVKVKPGYARNYLIPYGMAMQATEENQKQFETEREALQAKVDAKRATAQSLADKLDGRSVAIEVRVGESDKLYGSVTAVNIAEALEADGVELDRRKILLEAPIRALGIYPVEVKLHADVRATMEVAVCKVGQTPDELKAAIAEEEAKARGEVTPEAMGAASEEEGEAVEAAEGEEVAAETAPEASAEASVESTETAESADTENA